MTADISPQFVDTNLLIYAYDIEAGEKFKIANELLKSLWKEQNGCISLQVLQELYVNLTRKIKTPLSVQEVKLAILDLSKWTVHRPTTDDILAAIDLHECYQISFWDALVIRSAQQTGCQVLWSEDLAAGQDYDGVKVVNPFK